MTEKILTLLRSESAAARSAARSQRLQNEMRPGKTGGWVGDQKRPSNFRHGHAPAGQASPEYRTWTLMLHRCHNPTDKRFSHYGGRGITVCVEWRESFKNFLEDMGSKPPGLSLDRIDNSKGYSKQNCRWADARTQSNNRRSNHVIDCFGKSQTLMQWSRETGLHYRTIANRIRLGWSVEKTLTQKSRFKNERTT